MKKNSANSTEIETRIVSGDGKMEFPDSRQDDYILERDISRDELFKLVMHTLTQYSKFVTVNQTLRMLKDKKLDRHADI